MSKYTTGELAKLCDVSVRTVQYYDTRGILIPSELTEGGRRLYSENDLKKMKVICFLRDIGLPINSIQEILSESDPESVISILLDQQKEILRREIDERQTKLCMLEDLKRKLKNAESVTVETIGDIAKIMKSKQKLFKLRIIMLILGIFFGYYRDRHARFMDNQGDMVTVCDRNADNYCHRHSDGGNLL